MTSRKALLRPWQRVVVKIGSAQVTEPGLGLAHQRISAWCAQIDALMRQGIEVLLVSSGAVAEGCHRLGLAQRPSAMAELQAAAAVGQMGLIQAYETAFAKHERHPALILLTGEDLSDRQRYLNARAALQALWKLGVVPVINENDTVATDEIRFGDNDTLAALVTNLVQADALIILTDQGGLHTGDPRQQADAQLINFAQASDPSLDAYVATGVGGFGRGGMLTKLRAARLAARAGAHTFIANGSEVDVLPRLMAGAELGTMLGASEAPLDARKRWIADQLQACGDVTLDVGAAAALAKRGVSLLSVGVTAVSGDFDRGDLVRLLDSSGRPLGQGLVNYSSVDARQLIGIASSAIEAKLGYRNEDELVHCDNLVLL